MVVHDLDVHGARGAFRPLETDPPLVVDADAVLAFAVAFEPFQAVPGQRAKVLERDGRLQTVEPQLGLVFDARKGFDPLAGGEVPGAFVPVADDHDSKHTMWLCITSSITTPTGPNNR